MTPGAAMTPGERAARDEANRLRLMTARLVAECDRLRAEVVRLGDLDVEVLAEAFVASRSSGCCHLGRVCALCDCFADEDGGADRDEHARSEARTALDYVRRHRLH